MRQAPTCERQALPGGCSLGPQAGRHGLVEALQSVEIRPLLPKLLDDHQAPASWRKGTLDDVGIGAVEARPATGGDP
jgi:hypothetical protein